MPSSLIIVALAVAWLVVLVPMVARKRQEIARTGEDAMASRVVRRPGARGTEREESAMAADDTDRIDDVEYTADEFDDAEYDDVELEEFESVPATADPRYDAVEDDAEYDGYDDVDGGADGVEYEDDVEDDRARDAERSSPAARYRPGRGGFDPEAAEIAARAKYTFRQRVVLGLLITVVLSAVLAAVVWSGLWWATGVAGAGLGGYLGYLRRQVRIESEIRERRLARLEGARSTERRMRREAEVDAEYDREVEYAEPQPADDGRPRLAGVERKPRPHLRRPPRNAVVLDVDDEDPAFVELDEPSHPVYRRAVGE